MKLPKTCKTCFHWGGGENVPSPEGWDICLNVTGFEGDDEESTAPISEGDVWTHETFYCSQHEYYIPPQCSRCKAVTTVLEVGIFLLCFDCQSKLKPQGVG